MRIISQDKEFDLPYEETTIRAFNNGTVAAFSLTDLESNAFIIMAEYSTEEKAIKAMEMCRQEYGKYFGIQGGISPITGAVTQPGIFTYPKVFQFPKEEEVENE
jgi:hypothetical protein|nr:MAG TPA: hypothetical protein [Caudoviricetes sp.]